MNDETRLFENQEPLVTAEAVAEYFGVKRRTVYGWVSNDRDFPSYKIGGLRKFRLSEVLEYSRRGTLCQSNE